MGGILRYVGGRVASCIERYAAIAPREVTDLRLEAAVIVGKLVDENNWGTRPGLFVIEADAVIGGDMRHCGAFVTEKLAYPRSRGIRVASACGTILGWET